jgi:hypothetical protein
MSDIYQDKENKMSSLQIDKVNISRVNRPTLDTTPVIQTKQNRPIFDHLSAKNNSVIFEDEHEKLTMNSLSKLNLPTVPIKDLRINCDNYENIKCLTHDDGPLRHHAFTIQTLNIKMPEKTDRPNADKHNRISSHTNLNININMTISPQKTKIIYLHSNDGDPHKIHKDTDSLIHVQANAHENGNDHDKYAAEYCDLVDGERENRWRLEDRVQNYIKTVVPKIGRKDSNGPNSVTSPKKNWKKLSNLFRSLNSLHRYETKNFVDDSEFDVEMKDYKSRLFDNTIKGRRLPTLQQADADSNKKSLFDSRLINLLENEYGNVDNKSQINFKEEIYRLIINGDAQAVKKIDTLMKRDPEYYLKDQNDPTTKFNTQMPNGKTLLYIACQEGKIDIVKYLIDKRLNPFVKSKMDEREMESPLGVASRWNFINIVNLLLEKVPYKKGDLEEVLGMQGLTKKIRSLLKRHYTNQFIVRKSFFCC